MARDKGLTTTQLALAWLMAQGPDIIPIPSSTVACVARFSQYARSVGVAAAHLEEKRQGRRGGALTDEDLRRLDAILPYGAAAGDRTRDMKRVNSKLGMA